MSAPAPRISQTITPPRRQVLGLFALVVLTLLIAASAALRARNELPVWTVW